MANVGAEVVKRGQRYGICFAPSQFTDVGPAKLFGWWAEALVMLNYLKKMAAVPFVTDWFDIQARVPGLPDPSPIDNPVNFFNFLVRHHPQLKTMGDDWNLEFRAGDTKVPDILTARPDRRDYYEIKPGSTSGIAAGNLKLNKLAILFAKAKYGLQAYKAGTTYTPGNSDDIDISRFIPRILNLWAKRLGISKIKVVLSWRRSKDKPGLILYWICVDLETDDDDFDHAKAENVARWYTVHMARSLKANAALTDQQVSPELQFEFSNPNVRRIMPNDLDVIRAAMLSAGPATQYAIVGGQLAVDMVNGISRAELAWAKMRVEAVKGWLTVLPTQRYFSPPPLGSEGVGGPLAWWDKHGDTVIEVIVVVLVVAAIVATGGVLAAVAAESAAAGEAASIAAPAVLSGLETEKGVEAVSLATYRAAQAVRAAQAAKTLAAAAGIFAVLGFSRDALASGRPAAAPVVSSVQGLRLVAAQDIANFKDAPAFGSVTIPGGGSGFLLGRITLVGGAGTELKLEPHKPVE